VASRGRAAAAGLALAAALGLAWLALRRPLPPAPRLDVLLVTVDTLRADHVGCYGWAGAATPVLDGLAARGVRFATAVAHAPLTAPSHASVLTGLTPLRHGLRDNGSFSLPASVPTLAEAFRAAGYRTAAFVSGFPLDRRFGLGRGFELYDDRLPHGNDPRRAPYVERPADATTRAALAWLAAAPGAWFAWVHYFDPHAPYEPPPDLLARFAANPYDGEIAFADRELGRLLAGLGPARERTLVLVTADHGESLGEHGEDTHGVFVYDSTLRVPWIVQGPGVGAGRVASVVARGIDVAPTLLDLAGLPAMAGSEGRSLRPALSGRPMDDAPAYAESLFARLNLGWAPLHAWRSARWKYIEAPEPELYALDADAAEQHNRSQERPDVAVSLRAPLLRALETRPPSAKPEAGAESAERLRSLGYLGGAAPRAASLRDPKSALALLRRLERGLADARSDPEGARKDLAAVLAEEPRLPLALRYHAVASQAAGRYADALADLDALEREQPPSLEDLVTRAETLRLARRGADALAVLERAARLDAVAPEPALLRGRVLRSLGRDAEAAAAYAEALRRVPEHAEAARGLAEIEIQRGDVDAGARRLEALLARDPSDQAALVKLGVARVRSGALGQAVDLFEKAVVLDPRDPEALLDLAGALAKSGRTGEALPYFERAIEAGGPTTVALNGLGFARLESGDAAGALDALRRSLALDPRQAQVAQAVARLARGARP
jgi:arylsulfatase A-like enzyme/Flp pilus assembly protein TadD